MTLKIKSLGTSFGYLENAKLDFADGLTCIIGSRGTCKSTIVETIRFLFDSDKVKIREMVSDSSSGDHLNYHFKGLIRATLASGVAKCVAVEGLGEQAIEVVIERDVESAEPRIYRENVKEVSDKRILNKIEIYSQGDLQKIADSGEKRLELIDLHHKAKIDHLVSELNTYKKELSSLGPEIRELRILIENRKAEIKGLPAYRQQLEQLKSEQPAFDPELNEERTRFTDRQSILGKIKDVCSYFGEAENKVEDLIRYEANLNSALAGLTSLELKDSSYLVDRLTKFSNFISFLKKEKELLKPVPDSEVAKFSEGVEKLNSRYYELRQAQENVNESLKRQDLLLKQIDYLEEINKELDEILATEKHLVEKRKILRSHINTIADEIYTIRLAEVEEINSQFSNNVILNLKQSALCESYQNKLCQLLAGSRLRNREEIAYDTAMAVTPSELVDIVEAGDSQRLAQVLDRDLSQMARLVAYLLDNAEFYEIEGEQFQDELDIQLYVDGVPKRVDQLSKGQKATALLPLIMRHAPYPLIFDQPEDDLDNRFICETLIKDGIKKLKGKRQLIFITHNANIPVLGDADKVIVMKMKCPDKADKPICGNVEEVKEEIIKLLEGGKDAFKFRQNKYNMI